MGEPRKFPIKLSRFVWKMSSWKNKNDEAMPPIRITFVSLVICIFVCFLLVGVKGVIAVAVLCYQLVVLLSLLIVAIFPYLADEVVSLSLHIRFEVC